MCLCSHRIVRVDACNFEWTQTKPKKKNRQCDRHSLASFHVALTARHRHTALLCSNKKGLTSQSAKRGIPVGDGHQSWKINAVEVNTQPSASKTGDYNRNLQTRPVTNQSWKCCASAEEQSRRRQKLSIGCHPERKTQTIKCSSAYSLPLVFCFSVFPLRLPQYNTSYVEYFPPRSG